MIKHFEHLWEEAEAVVTEWYNNQGEHNTNVTEDLRSPTRLAPFGLSLNAIDSMSEEARQEWMGQMLITLCYISKKYDINTYAVLKEAMNDIKVDMLDPDIEMDV